MQFFDKKSQLQAINSELCYIKSQLHIKVKIVFYKKNGLCANTVY